MARWIGTPVARSHTTVVSRWFVMPMAAISVPSTRASDNAERTERSTVDQISSASCSTQPGCG